jgi:hypothetical protein
MITHMATTTGSTALTCPAEVPTARAAEPTTPAMSFNRTGPGGGGALPACKAPFAIPTDLSAIAEAMEGLRLPGAVGAVLIVRSNLPVLLAELALSASTGFRTFATRQLPISLRALPVGDLSFVWTVTRLSSRATALEITSYPLRAAVG